MVKKKKFVTKKNIKWKMIDTIVYSVIFIGVIIYAIHNIVEINNINAVKDVIIKYPIIIIPSWIFAIIVSAVPYIIIYLGIRYSIKKYNKSIVTFDVEHDLEYYREKFNGISPATMSLLMDLNLEENKDLGAMKLYYELHDIYMYVRDGKTGINNPNSIKLNYSDELLLKYFFDNNSNTLIQWKENVIRETIYNNLIIRKNGNDRKKVSCGIFLIVNIMAFIFFILGFLYIDDLGVILDTINANSQTDEEALEIFLSNPQYVSMFFVMVITSFAFIVWLWTFVGGFIHLIVGNVVKFKDKFKRTKEGNILAEKLYGMKNFIKDFSNLDEASKKQLVLWDEFLIYAVVLEENDNILNEISNIYHTDLLKYKNFKN